MNEIENSMRVHSPSATGEGVGAGGSVVPEAGAVFMMPPLPARSIREREAKTPAFVHERRTDG